MNLSFFSFMKGKICIKIMESPEGGSVKIFLTILLFFWPIKAM